MFIYSFTISIRDYTEADNEKTREKECYLYAVEHAIIVIWKVALLFRMGCCLCRHDCCHDFRRDLRIDSILRQNKSSLLCQRIMNK